MPGAVEFKPYRGSDLPIWDQFVEESLNGTLFHKQDFLSYHDVQKTPTPFHLMAYQKNRLISVIPGFIEESDKEKTYKSPWGASWGGPVFQKRDYKLETIHSFTRALVDYLRLGGISSIVIGPTPSFYYEHMGDYLEFSLIKSGLSLINLELTGVIPVNGTNYCASIAPPERSAVRKAERLGLQCHCSDDFTTFYSILQRSKSRHNASATHTLDELLILKRLVPDRIQLFLVEEGSVSVGGTLLFHMNRMGSLAFYMCHLEEHQDRRPVNYMISYLVSFLRENRKKILDLGTITYKMEPRWGVVRFKENMGAFGCSRKTFFLRI